MNNELYAIHDPQAKILYPILCLLGKKKVTIINSNLQYLNRLKLKDNFNI